MPNITNVRNFFNIIISTHYNERSLQCVNIFRQKKQ